MSLLTRIHANQCAVRLCTRARVSDAQVCREDLTELYHNRLDRQPDGTYTRRRSFPAREDASWRVAA